MTMLNLAIGATAHPVDRHVRWSTDEARHLRSAWREAGKRMFSRVGREPRPTEIVLEMIRKALVVERALPDRERGQLAARSCWPDYDRDERPKDGPSKIRFLYSPGEVSQSEVVLRFAKAHLRGKRQATDSKWQSQQLRDWEVLKWFAQGKTDSQIVRLLVDRGCRRMSRQAVGDRKRFQSAAIAKEITKILD